MITIRKAQQEDWETLADIGLRAWHKAMMPVGETAAMIDNARSAFTRFTQNGWITIIIVESGGTPVGWAAREDLDEMITDFWIDPDHQRQGMGSALLVAVEEDMRRMGQSEARLETHARNHEAVAFFRSHGYAIQWLSVVYNPKLDRDLETVSMVKTLESEEALTYGPMG